MSGGTFDYYQYKLHEISEIIESEILKSGREKTEDEIKNEIKYQYISQPDKFYPTLPDEVLEKFKHAYKLIKETEIYIHRIDWLLSGDDRNETFLERLKNDLHTLEAELKIKNYD